MPSLTSTRFACLTNACTTPGGQPLILPLPSPDAGCPRRCSMNKSKDAAQSGRADKLPRKIYERELAKLHEELVLLQKWIVERGQKACLVFEGRDGAGKGGTIKAITERVSPRVFHVVALTAPTEREKTQMYFQRYVPHLPAAGEITIFDRSWYNRAGVERVMGFCTEEEAERFLEVVHELEHLIVESD